MLETTEAIQKYIDYGSFLAFCKSHDAEARNKFITDQHSVIENCFMIGGNFENNAKNLGVVRDLMQISDRVIFIAYDNVFFEAVKKAVKTDGNDSKVFLFNGTNRYIYSYILDLCLFFEESDDERGAIRTMLNSHGRLFYSASPYYDAPDIEKSAESSFEQLGTYSEDYKRNVLGIKDGMNISQPKDLYRHIHGKCFDDAGFEKFYYSGKSGYEQFLYIASLGILNRCFLDNVKKINYKNHLYGLGLVQFIEADDKRSFFDMAQECFV